MKKWIAALLALVMLSQALPWTAFAATGDPITDAELQRALLTVGLRPESGGDVRALFEAASEGGAPLRLEAKESGYHPGMKPDGTWDARMMMDWLDDLLMTDIYNVTSVFTRAETILDKLKDDDPAAYARFTEGAVNAEYVKTCHKWAMDAEAAEEQARFYRQRVNE